jgi:hypothetical protein
MPDWLVPFDRDRSHTLVPAELEAVPCEVWSEADQRSRRIDGMSFLARYGLAPGMWFRATSLGIPGSSRAAAHDAVQRCLGDTAARSLLPDLIRGLGAPPGSPDWDRLVGTLLRIHFDADGSGRLDRDLEILAIPCDVFIALNEALLAEVNSPFAPTYGIAAGFEWVGGELAFDESHRELLSQELSRCLGADQLD